MLSARFLDSTRKTVDTRSAREFHNEFIQISLPPETLLLKCVFPLARNTGARSLHFSLAHTRARIGAINYARGPIGQKSSPGGWRRALPEKCRGKNCGRTGQKSKVRRTDLRAYAGGASIAVASARGGVLVCNWLISKSKLSNYLWPKIQLAWAAVKKPGGSCLRRSLLSRLQKIYFFVDFLGKKNFSLRYIV